MATWDTTTTTIVIHTWITEITEVTSLTAEVATGAHVTVIELQVTLLYLKLIMCLKFPTFFSFFFVCLNRKSFISFINFAGRIWLAIKNNRMPRKMFATFAINTEKNHITLSYLLSNMIQCYITYNPHLCFYLDVKTKLVLEFQRNLILSWVLVEFYMICWKVHMAYLNIFFYIKLSTKT